jgi:hypothetical protein
MAISKEQRNDLEKLLPRNFRLIISARMKCHVNTVTNVLHGKTTDRPDIEKALGRLAKETKAKQEEVAKIINQL